RRRRRRSTVAHARVPPGPPATAGVPHARRLIWRSTSEVGGVQVVAARGRVARLEAAVPGLLTLLGCAVMRRVARVEVTDGEGGIQRLLHITVFEPVLA